MLSGEELCLESQDLEHEVPHSSGRSWSRVAGVVFGLGAAVGLAGYILDVRSSSAGVVSDAKHLISDYVAPPFQDMLCPASTMADIVGKKVVVCTTDTVSIEKIYNVIDCQKQSMDAPGQTTAVGTSVIYHYKDGEDVDIAGNSKTPGDCFYFPTTCTKSTKANSLPGNTSIENYHTCTIQQPQCFPGEAIVDVQGHGSLAMASVKVGDKILVESTTGALVYEEVLSFLHIAPRAEGTIARVLYAGGELRATSNHLVFVAEMAQDGSLLRTAKMVGELKPGDAVFVARDGFQVKERVLAVQYDIVRAGVFAPLTSSGTVVVDNVVASNYGSPSNVLLPHGAAHASFFVARVWHKALLMLNLAQGTSVDEMHVVAKTFQDLGLDRLLRPVSA